MQRTRHCVRGRGHVSSPGVIVYGYELRRLHMGTEAAPALSRSGVCTHSACEPLNVEQTAWRCTGIVSVLTNLTFLTNLTNLTNLTTTAQTDGTASVCVFAGCPEL